jgi:hypothetical protein
MGVLTVRCGCCDERFKICYSQDGLEIAGVMASLDQWRKLLGPLLRRGKP